MICETGMYIIFAIFLIEMVLLLAIFLIILEDRLQIFGYFILGAFVALLSSPLLLKCIKYIC